jgi:hypothetical protein
MATDARKLRGQVTEDVERESSQVEEFLKKLLESLVAEQARGQTQ